MEPRMDSATSRCLVGFSGGVESIVIGPICLISCHRHYCHRRHRHHHCHHHRYVSSVDGDWPNLPDQVGVVVRRHSFIVFLVFTRWFPIFLVFLIFVFLSSDLVGVDGDILFCFFCSAHGRRGKVLAGIGNLNTSVASIRLKLLNLRQLFGKNKPFPARAACWSACCPPRVSPPDAFILRCSLCQSKTTLKCSLFSCDRSCPGWPSLITIPYRKLRQEFLTSWCEATFLRFWAFMPIYI